MNTVANILAGILLKRQLPSGGWSYFDSRQSSIEATSLAIMAVGLDAPDAQRPGIAHLLAAQRADGSWPAFLRDLEGSWTTALALCTLSTIADFVGAGERALQWLNTERGRESHWFWRWKFKIADRNIRFDPDKYGWPWVAGSASWVIPTAFSIIAVKQFTVCNRSAASEGRIHTGVDMLLDRACVDGGWNSGNALYTGSRYAHMLRRQRSRCWLCRMNSEPK